ncbi:MAG TPA: carboxypeptidase-like regulatory domain-containing protein [Bryobacteraceae bacterium]|nr:carboxypeptidase-like regulatory domain-containing protein [Bryobacteraceae bacterium]
MRHASLLFLLPLGLAAQNGGAVPQAAPSAAPSPQSNAPETKPEDLASIEGQVSDANTGEPLRKANLVLRRTDVNPNGGTIPTSYTTSSDNGGKFVMDQIEPGRYRLTVDRTGYTNGEYGAPAPGRQGTTLSLGRAQKLTDLTLKLTPHGVVTGRIVDRDGDPVAAVQVQMMRYRYVNGRKQLTFANGNSTNDLGEYRIYGIAPGRYFVSATYRANQFGTALDRSATPDEDYAPTYYPGTFDISTAAEVSVTPGGQARVDLTLAKTRTARVSGRVINTAAPAALTTSVMLTPRGGFIGPFLNRSVVSGANGKFELRGVPPGSYDAIASTNFGGKTYTTRQAVEIGTGNIENLTLTIGAGTTINGRLRIDGNPASAPSSIQVTLRPRELGIIFGPIPTVTVKDDGSFALADVNPDNYNLFFPGLPEGYYAKSIRSGDTDVLTNGLDLVSGAPGNLDVVLSPNAGQATGTVQNPKTQQPMPGATVVLIPTERERNGQQTYYKTATTDQSGSFTLKSIVPGEYKAYAWEDIETGAYFDPDFMKAVEGKGEAVSVRESSQLNLQLTMIPSDSAPSVHSQ